MMTKNCLFVGLIWLLWQGAAVAQICPADVVYSTYIGDSAAEEGAAIAVDDDGRAYIAGTTFSIAFPITATTTTQRQAPQHGVDAVSFRLSADGTTADNLQWINPLAENDEDYGRAIGLDAAGNWYVAGETRSADFCASISAIGYDTTYNGNGDGFIYKQNVDGTIAYCTYIGGNNVDIVRDMAVLPDGRVTVTGGTWSDDFSGSPGTPAARDIFVLQVVADGTSLNYSKLLGGSGQESGLKLLHDTAENTWITGWTYSTDLPVVNAFDSTANGDVDAYVARLSADGTTWQMVSYVGGADGDRAYALAINADGDVVVAGRTGSADFPITPTAFDSTFSGVGYDGFVAVINDNALLYSTYLGGAMFDQINTITTNGNEIWLAGMTGSADFPITDNTVLNGAEDAFITALTPGQPTLNHSRYFGGSRWDQILDLTIEPDGVYVVGQTLSADLCTTPAARDTTHNGDYDMFITKFASAVPLAITLKKAAGSTAGAWWLVGWLLLAGSTWRIIHAHSKAPISKATYVQHHFLYRRQSQHTGRDLDQTCSRTEWRDHASVGRINRGVGSIDHRHGRGRSCPCCRGGIG